MEDGSAGGTQDRARNPETSRWRDGFVLGFGRWESVRTELGRAAVLRCRKRKSQDRSSRTGPAETGQPKMGPPRMGPLSVESGQDGAWDGRSPKVEAGSIVESRSRQHPELSPEEARSVRSRVRNQRLESGPFSPRAGSRSPGRPSGAAPRTEPGAGSLGASGAGGRAGVGFGCREKRPGLSEMESGAGSSRDGGMADVWSTPSRLTGKVVVAPPITVSARHHRSGYPLAGAGNAHERDHRDGRPDNDDKPLEEVEAV